MKQALVILQSCQYKIEDAIEFAQANGLKGDKIDDSVKELSSELLSKVDYCLCKCQAKYLVSQAKHDSKDDAQINSASDPKNAKMKSIEFDNVYDILFDDALKQKPDQNKNKKIVIGQQDDNKALLNFLESGNL